MSYYYKQQAYYYRKLANAKLIDSILNNPDDYSTNFLKSVVTDYETFYIPTENALFSKYRKLVNIINNREKQLCLFN